jgi:hypothetical protein
MATPSLTVRDGTTDNIDMALKADGNAIDLSTVTSVSINMIDNADKVYTYSTTDASPLVSILSPSGGTVRFSPTSNIFIYTRSPYKFYIVVDNGSFDYNVPEDGYAQITVLKEY